VSELSPAEITWQFMLVAKSPIQVDAAGRTTKLAFTDTGEVSWIRLLAKDGLIEIIDDDGLVGIQGLTAKGALILNKAPDRKTWIKVIGPIIDAGEPITLQGIEERRWYRRLIRLLKEVLSIIPR
jgi:hypothetical protein